VIVNDAAEIHRGKPRLHAHVDGVVGVNGGPHIGVSKERTLRPQCHPQLNLAGPGNSKIATNFVSSSGRMSLYPLVSPQSSLRSEHTRRKAHPGIVCVTTFEKFCDGSEVLLMHLEATSSLLFFL